MQFRHPDKAEIAKGLAAGAIAGIAASWAMNQFQSFLAKAEQKLEQGEQPKQHSDSRQQHGGDDENATVKAARQVSRGVLHRDLPQDKEKKEQAGAAVHYAFGGAMGAAYGAASEVLPAVRTGAGTAFAGALWLGADEGLVPALGLSKPPLQYPAKTHASALASHLVYGVTTELVRRAIRAAW